MKNNLFLVIVSLVSVIFLSGCLTVRVTDVRKPHQTPTELHEKAIVTKSGKVIATSPANFTITNVCPVGYSVEFRKRSDVVVPDLQSGQSITVYPSAARGERVTFSVRVYKILNGSRELVRIDEKIIEVPGDRFLTLTWAVGQKDSNINSAIQSARSRYGYHGYGFGY